MKYQNFINGKFPDNFLYAERYLGGGTKTYSKFSSEIRGNERYFPESPDYSFELQTFLINKEKLDIFEIGNIDNLYVSNNEIIFPVHPYYMENQDENLVNIIKTSKPGPTILVSPTASLRTVFVHSINGKKVTPHFIKLNYPFRISRFNRRLRKRSIELQVWCSGRIIKYTPNFLEDNYGCAIGKGNSAWGFIIRSAKAIDNNLISMPLFALYGYDTNFPQNQDNPLLIQIPNYYGQDPLDWVESNIIRPILKLWTETIINTGLILELHGQNTVILINDDGKTEIIGRDADVYGLTRIIKTKKYNNMPQLLKEEANEREDSKALSLIYDRSIGHHMFAYIGKVLEDFNLLTIEEFKLKVKKIFKEECKNIGHLLPKEEYGYKDTIIDNNGFILEVKSKNPEWR